MPIAGAMKDAAGGAGVVKPRGCLAGDGVKQYLTFLL